MKRLIDLSVRVVIAALVVAAISGCSGFRPQSWKSADEIERRMKRDLVKFYEKQGYSYFLLGYEYYGLANEAEETHAPALRVKDYRAKARLYYVFSQDLQSAANELRRETDERAPLTPASEYAVPPPPSGTSLSPLDVPGPPPELQ
ncbi:hypothetical protein JW916_00595 [Candidatus Sumerlaeota bacterium]|nr:hypothetical protein [Candidatus Sumerlaeota bacterium]